jgi:hypothetical protein
MRFRTNSAIVTALAMTLAGSGAFAQAPSAQDHNAHHPPGAAPTQPAQPAAPADGGMMGGKGGMMMGPGGMMGAGMMCADMMGGSHAENRIAALKVRLNITEAQTPQWERFADSIRAAGKAMSDAHKAMMQPMPPAKPLPEQLADREQMMAAHLAAVKAMREALQPLYASLSGEQKKIADVVIIGPMGMM